MATNNIIIKIFHLILISFLVILPIQLSSASEFSLDSPETAGNEFLVSISSESNVEDIYDVKIYVYQDKKTDRLSEIYDAKWKSAFYYIKSAFPDSNSFKIRALNLSGQSTICAKLRKSGQTSFKEVCNSITIDNSRSTINQIPTINDNNNINENDNTNDEKNDIDNDDVDDVDDVEDNSDNENDKGNIEDNKVTFQETTTPLYSNSNNINDRIVLNSPKAQRQKEYVSTREKIRRYLLYANLFFILILVIALTIQYLKKSRNI